MKRDLTALQRREYDLLVIGGGIFGACAAWDGALRGLSVALLERGDFAGGTTSNSYKVAHGGIRYLQHGDVTRVRESSRERSVLLRVAPHQVYPLPILVPSYGRGKRGKGVLRAGFSAYDLLTVDRNRGITDPQRHIPSASFLSKEEVLAHFPGLPQHHLTGGVVFHDAQMYSPARLALSFLRAAVEVGAEIANYVEVTGFLTDANRVRGAAVRDHCGGKRLDIRARMVLNATGPWAVRLLETHLGLDLGSEKPSFSRDVGLVTRRRLSPDLGLACPTVTRDAEAILDRGGRHLFLLPWRDFTLVGVWHGLSSSLPDEVSVSDPEVRDFVADANRAYPELRLGLEDVSVVNTGLILFGDENQSTNQHRFGKQSLLIDHAPKHQIEGLITLIGVRATTARGMAEKAIDLALQKLGEKARPCWTADAPVYGGDIPCFEELVNGMAPELPNPKTRRALAHNYGSRYKDVLAFAEEDPELIEPIDSSTVFKAEVVHAVRHEMALHLEDVVLRRTDLGTAGNPGRDALEICARLMARELGWDEPHVSDELAKTRECFGRHEPASPSKHVTLAPA